MGNLWKVEFFVDANGGKPVEEYLSTLERGEIRRFWKRLGYLSQTGLGSGDHLSDKIEDDLYELRLPNSPHNPRFLYCAVVGRCLYLLHGFSKTGQKTDKVPFSEIRIAKKRRALLHEQIKAKQQALEMALKKVKK